MIYNILIPFSDDIFGRTLAERPNIEQKIFEGIKQILEKLDQILEKLD